MDVAPPSAAADVALRQLRAEQAPLVVDQVVDTLGALLSRMGHRCRGRCPVDAVSIQTPARIVPPRTRTGSTGLLVLDLTRRPEPLLELFGILRAVNRCTRLDRILVLPGHLDERPMFVDAPGYGFAVPA